MTVTKYYESGSLIVYAHEDCTAEQPQLDIYLTFDNERQMRRLGECLKDLSRTGGNKVSIG